MKEKSDRQKRNIRVSVSEDEYKFVRELLHKQRPGGRKAKITEFENVLGDWISNFPDGADEVPNPIHIEGKTAILSDIHLGVHDKNALIAALTYLKKEHIDNIILNGDVIDTAELGKHTRTVAPISYSYEIDIANKFLDSLATEFPKVKIYFKEGNHEDRLARYIQEQANKLDGLISLPQILNLAAKNIQHVATNQFIIHKSLNIVHGHEMKVSGGVNPARSLLLKSFSDCIMGHVHKTSASHGRNMQGNFIRTWTMGCLCKLQQGYMPHSNANHGFAISEDDGEVRNMWIVNNNVVY